MFHYLFLLLLFSLITLLRYTHAHIYYKIFYWEPWQLKIYSSHCMKTWSKSSHMCSKKFGISLYSIGSVMLCMCLSCLHLPGGSSGCFQVVSWGSCPCLHMALKRSVNPEITPVSGQDTASLKDIPKISALFHSKWLELASLFSRLGFTIHKTKLIMPDYLSRPTWLTYSL